MRCVLCAKRGRQTEGDSHVCVPCAAHLQVQVADIARLAAEAAAWIDPLLSGGSGGNSRPVPGSRPPLRVECLDPELTPIGPAPSATVLEVLESWERMIREMRAGMAPYGPASAHRAAALSGVYAGTSATLVGVVDFLGRQVSWMTTEPDFPVDDFADEVHACVRVLRRWDRTAEQVTTMIRCPTPTDETDDNGLAKPCGFRLYYADVHEDVTCKRCGATRSAMTLAAVAMVDGAEVWLDPEAAAKHLGVSESTLLRLARKGAMRKSHGRYCVSDMQPVA